MSNTLQNRTKAFDFCLKEGVKYENLIAELLQGKKVEVKTEFDIWKTSGNIAIELKYRGQASGISSTEAEYWAHILVLNGEIKGFYIYPVSLMRRFIRENHKNKDMMEIKNGGDNNWSSLCLIKLSELYKISLC